MAQDNCPFTRTKKNDVLRFNPGTERTAVCFQLHDDLREMFAMAILPGDRQWLEAINKLKLSLDFAKKAKGVGQPSAKK